MDETGQPGDAVPANNHGTDDHGNGYRRHSWAPSDVDSLASTSAYRSPAHGGPAHGGPAHGGPAHGGPAHGNGANGSAWSGADAVIDALDSSWPAYDRLVEAMPAAASGARQPASAPPYPYDPDSPPELDRDSTTGFPSVARAPVPLPPGHVSLADMTPWRGMPAVAPLPEAEALLPQPRASRPWPDEPEALPQRVPAEPDVPALPEPVAVDDPRAEDPELARIATYLKHDDPGQAQATPRRDSFDVEAVLAAVKEVSGVRGAELRRNPGGVHTLRLDLADGADPALISRAVARLLNERMGLAAAVGAPGESRGLYRSGGIDPMRAARAESAFTALADATRTADAEHEGQRRHAATGALGRATVQPRRPADDLLGGPTTDLSGQRYPATGPAMPSAGQPAPGMAGQPAPVMLHPHERASQPLPPRGVDVHRVVIENVRVSTHGLDAAVEVRLMLGDRRAIGESCGPAVDGYVLRLAAISAAAAIDQLLVDPAGQSRGRCFVEHAAVLPLGGCELAAVVLLLVCNGWVEQLVGSALVSGDPRQAVVRATLSAVNRRLESLLP